MSGFGFGFGFSPHGALLNYLPDQFPNTLRGILVALYDNSTGIDYNKQQEDATVTSTAITLPESTDLIAADTDSGAAIYFVAGTAQTVLFADIYENYGNQLFSNTLYTVIFSRELTESELTDFYWWFGHSVFDLTSAHADSPLNITSPYADVENSIVHPSALFFKNGFAGYKYWLTYTPLPQGVGDPVEYENPCVIVSNDKVNWIELITNPIAIYSVDRGWLSDSFLYYESGTIYLIYRAYINNGDNLYVKTTQNGLSWSDELLLKAGGGSGAGHKLMSPSIVKQDNKYYLFCHETASGATLFDQNILVRWESDAILGTYSNRQVCAYDISQSRVNLSKVNTQFFHTDIKLINNVLYGLPFSLGTHVAAGIYLMKSYDKGLNWTVGHSNLIKIWNAAGEQAIKFDVTFYRSSIVFNDETKVIELFYTGLNSNLTPDYSIGLSEISANKKIYLSMDERNYVYLKKIFNDDIVKANLKQDDWIFADDFVRADTAEGLGTSSSGDTWLPNGTQNMIISDNTAIGYNPTGVNRQIVELSTNSQTGFLIVSIADPNYGVISLKHLGSNNHLIIDSKGMTVYATNGIGGTQKTFMSQIPIYTPLKDNEFSWWTNGDRYKVYCNGYMFADITLSELGYIPADSIASWIANKKICLYDYSRSCTYKKILVKSN